MNEWLSDVSVFEGEEKKGGGGGRRENHLLDGDQGIAQAIELTLVLALGRLNHQGASHRPRHGGGVEAVVLQTLCHILSFVLSRQVSGWLGELLVGGVERKERLTSSVTPNFLKGRRSMINSWAH